MRFLGLDYGSVTIGVAISDRTNTIATGLETIRRPNEISIKKSIRRLKEIIREHDIDTIVLGYPKNLDNTEGERCEKTLEFRDRLKRNFKSMDIILWDERFSTLVVEESMMSLNVKYKKRQEEVDTAAATYILQGYLDYYNNLGDRNG